MSNREERIADRHLDKITINYFDKLVQITCDEALKNYLEEPGNGAVELSAHILKEHKKRQKSELKISKHMQIYFRKQYPLQSSTFPPHCQKRCLN